MSSTEPHGPSGGSGAASQGGSPGPDAPARVPSPHAAAEGRTIAGRKAALQLQSEREVVDRLRARFPEAVLGERTFAGQLFVDLSPEAIHAALRFLRDTPGLEFVYLVDLTCADYLKFPDYARARFGLTYVLYSFKLDARIRLKVWLPETRPEVASISDLFGAANWAEREVYDLYGIRFLGHPSLTRILLPDDYEGHPLRKDYPLQGRGERDSFPVLSRRES